MNFMYMRNHLVANHSSTVINNPWLKNTYNAVRQIAVKEAITAWKSAFTNIRNGNIKHFKAPFRRKKDRGWSFGIDPTQLKNNKLFPGSDFGFLHIAEPKYLKGVYDSQIKITRDDQLRFWIVILENNSSKKCCRHSSKRKIARADVTKEWDEQRIISIDPGIRTRHCCYSSTGDIWDVGNKQDIQKLINVALAIDKRISSANQKSNTHRRRRRHLKQRLKLTARMINLKKEMDDKTIRFLKTKADVILLPDFASHQIASRLRSKTARQLMTWGHGLFKSRLKTTIETGIQSHDRVRALHE